MRSVLLPTLFLVAIAPASVADAEENDNPMQPLFEFLELFSDEGASLLDEFMTEFGPMLEGLRDQVQDWTLYEAPEVLENGDIIIRRKPAPESDPDIPEGTREI